MLSRYALPTTTSYACTFGRFIRKVLIFVLSGEVQIVYGASLSVTVALHWISWVLY